VERNLDSANHVGWFALIRRVVAFCLGVSVILEAVVSAHNPIAEYVVGLILLGYVPIDELLSRLPRKGRNGSSS
jgi:hypothetical protein